MQEEKSLTITGDLNLESLAVLENKKEFRKKTKELCEEGKEINFWYDEETIPVQVSGKDGDPLENNGPEYYNSVYFGTNPSFNLGNGIYPNNPNDFYQAYVDTLSETLDKSKMIVKNEKNKK